jgi:hypothetical protein
MLLKKIPSLSYLSVRQEEALVFISWQEGGFSIKASCPSHLLRIRRMGRRDNTHKKNLFYFLPVLEFLNNVWGGPRNRVELVVVPARQAT